MSIMFELFKSIGKKPCPPGTRVERCPLIINPNSEDLLTSNVFGLLKYLPPAMWLTPLLEIAFDGRTFRSIDRGKIKVEFWKKLPSPPGAKHQEGIQEIDLVIRIQPSLRSTPTGKLSVTIDVLSRLCGSYSEVRSFLESVIEFKNAQTLFKSVKIVSKKLDLNPRIHPEFNHFSCATGRIYSYIQNLPKEVRKVLIPEVDENVFIELDWSQQELRILGALSREPIFLDCLAGNEDLHRRVISEMFHKPVSEVTDEERKLGKTVNYALIYGQKAPGLAWNLNIPLKKAQELIEQYFFSLPTIRKFKEESRDKFLTEGYAETVFGRQTRLDLAGPNKEKELRRGFNHIIQGTGADILRMTLVRLSEALKGQQGKLKFCAHDSIYLEAKKEDSEEASKLARSVMEIDFMGVHLPVAIKSYHDFSMGEGNA